MFDFLTHRSSTAKQAIFLVPKPDPFENPLVETNPAQLRQWATALPFANPEQLAEAVLANLGRLNRYPSLVKKRDELMEIYQIPVLRLCHSSNTRKGSVPIPVVRRAMLEVAFGYSHIANDCLCGKANRKSLDRLANAVYFSLKFYLLEYLYACDEFDCRTGYTYREVSRLRTFAEEQRIHQRVIEDSDLHEPNQATIEHQFNRYLLLSLLDPCHLQQEEPRICFEYLNSIAGHAQLKTPTAKTEPSGRYVLDRLGEVSPYPFDPETLEKLSLPRFTLFDLNPVSQQIHQQLRRLEKSEEQKPAAMNRLTLQETTNLLARMLKSWHIRTKRDSERHSTSGQVRIWAGIKQIHHHLTWQEEENNLESESDEITMTETHQLQATRQDPNKPQLIARRANQSRSGVALHLAASSVAMPLIGELVLISLQGTSDINDWKLGIVKRALNRTEGVLEIGVQFLLGRIVPISLQPVRPTSDEDDEPEIIPDYPALYIDQGHSHRSSLLVPKRFFVIGQEYRVEEMIPAPIITPLQLLENTAMFERYRVKGV
jgi:hypothetical protein